MSVEFLYKCRACGAVWSPIGIGGVLPYKVTEMMFDAMEGKDVCERSNAERLDAWTIHHHDNGAGVADLVGWREKQ